MAPSTANRPRRPPSCLPDTDRVRASLHRETRGTDTSRSSLTAEPRLDSGGKLQEGVGWRDDDGGMMAPLEPKVPEKETQGRCKCKGWKDRQRGIPNLQHAQGPPCTQQGQAEPSPVIARGESRCRAQTRKARCDTTAGASMEVRSRFLLHPGAVGSRLPFLPASPSWTCATKSFQLVSKRRHEMQLSRPAHTLSPLPPRAQLEMAHPWGVPTDGV